MGSSLLRSVTVVRVWGPREGSTPSDRRLSTDREYGARPIGSARVPLMERMSPDLPPNLTPKASIPPDAVAIARGRSQRGERPAGASVALSVRSRLCASSHLLGMSPRLRPPDAQARVATCDTRGLDGGPVPGTGGSRSCASRSAAREAASRSVIETVAMVLLLRLVGFQAGGRRSWRLLPALLAGQDNPTSARRELGGATSICHFRPGSPCRAGARYVVIRPWASTPYLARPSPAVARSPPE